MKGYLYTYVYIIMKTILSIVLAGLIILGGYFFFANRNDNDSDTLNTVGTTTGQVVGTGSTTTGATSTNSTSTNGTSTNTSSSTGSIVSTNDIRITSPRSGDTVRSPLTLTGEARGNWFFEASAPVELQDANGKKLAQGFITAQGEWMTTNFVPFTGTLTWTATSTGTTTAARVVFMNDNPSGLPSLQKSVVVPVTLSR